MVAERGYMIMASYRIDPLDKNNYDTWSVQAQAILIKNNLWEYANGAATSSAESDAEAKEKFAKQDMLARAELMLLMSPSQLKQVSGCKTSAEVWDKLKSIHQSSGPARKATLLKQLVLKKMTAREDVQDHLNNFMDVVDKLAVMGVEIHPELLSIMMLYSLPQNYENFRIAIESRDKLPIPDELKIKIIEESEARKNNDIRENAEGAFYSKNYRKQGNNSGHFKYRCNKCKKKGHKASECQEKAKYSDGKPETSSNHKNFNVSPTCLTSVKVFKKRAWCLDSGCTSHMCSDREKFESLNDESGELKLASEQHVTQVKGKGTITVSMKADHYNLNDALYVPELSTNLMSVGKITDHGYTVVFQKDQALLKDSSGKTVLKAKRNNELYYIEFDEIEKANAVEGNDTNIMRWHKKLGHLNESDLKAASRNEFIKGLEIKEKEKLGDCETCLKGKMTSQPFNKSDGIKTKEPLEIVHTDVCGPMQVETFAGSRYFVTFIDDFTRYCCVYFIKRKSDVFQIFKEYKNKMENFLKKKIKFLQSDNGTEYINKDFNEYLKQNGIQRRLTAPYTPQSNGLAERKNRSLIERARCLMLESHVPEELWADAVYTANYLINRCPAKALNGCVPFQRWMGREPSARHLHIFGHKAFILNKGPKRGGKFAPRAAEGVFVGYAKCARGYRIFIPDKEEVIVSRDVKIIDKMYYENHRNSSDPNFGDTNDQSQRPKSRRQEKENAKDMDVEWKQLSQIETVPSTSKQSETEPSDAFGDIFNDAIDGSTEDNAEIEVEHHAESEIIDEQVHDDDNNARRSQRIRKLPVWAKDYEIDGKDNTEISTDEMVNMCEEEENDNDRYWHEAIKSEIKAHIKNGTWKIVKREKDMKVIDFKMILKKKPGPKNTEIKKARLVARGFRQRPGIDYNETYSPVAKLSSIRSVIAISVEENLKLNQMDVTTAYLNGDLDKKIIMKKPDYLEEYVTEIMVEESKNDDLELFYKAKKMLEDLKNIKGEKVCLLEKALYGLKQSGRQWYLKLSSELERIGFIPTEADPCVYVSEKGGAKIVIAIYVDDLLIAYSCDRRLNEIKRMLNEKFEMKDLGEPELLLGMQIKRQGENEIKLYQEKYIEKALKKYNMETCKPTVTPIEPNLKLNKHEKCDEKLPYQQLIGTLMYLAVATRPDIMFTVSYLSQFNSCYGEEHFKSAKRVLRYLKGTKNLGLCYNKTEMELYGQADADFASCTIDRRSYSGFCFKLAGAPISWESKKQRSVALSTAEAEYVCVAEAAKEALHLKRLINAVSEWKQRIVTIYNDNQAAILLTKNPVVSSKTKHIDTKLHFLRQLKDINVEYLASTDMEADLLTKGLAGPRLGNLRSSLGLN